MPQRAGWRRQRLCCGVAVDGQVESRQVRAKNIGSEERFGLERQGSSVVRGPWPVVSGGELLRREYKRPTPPKKPLRGRHFELQTRNSEPLNPELSISDFGLWTLDFFPPHRSSFDAFHSPPPANYEILKCAVFPRLLQICTHRAPKLLPPPRARIMRTAARDKSRWAVMPIVRGPSRVQASRRVEHSKVDGRRRGGCAKRKEMMNHAHSSRDRGLCPLVVLYKSQLGCTASPWLARVQQEPASAGLACSATSFSLKFSRLFYAARRRFDRRILHRAGWVVRA
jgi:hypothetical protein